MANLKQWLSSLFLYGTNFTDDKNEQRKTKFINYITLPTLPLAFIIGLVNISNDKHFLAGTNFMVILCNVITYRIHPIKKYDLLKLVINLVLTITCSLQAICYHNGMEYFHIQNLVLILIFFEERNFIIPSIIFSIIAFAVTKYFTLYYPPFFEPLALERTISNVAWATGVTLFGLSYFKKSLQMSWTILEKKNFELQEASRTKEKLFSIISHDFRAPIGQLKGTLDLVNDQIISQKDFYKLSNAFYNQVDNLLNDMDNLLVWSQNQLSAISANPSIFSVKEIAYEVTNLIKQITSKKDIEVNLHLPTTLVFADINHIRIVLRNLLSNAVKFTKRGGKIYVYAIMNDEIIFVQIKDEGVGMSANQVKLLMKDEYLVSTTGTDNEKGTGLGLKICKELLSINHGSITIDSELGKGTIFTFGLPLAHRSVVL